MKLLRGRLFHSFPSSMSLRQINWTSDQFPGDLVATEMSSLSTQILICGHMWPPYFHFLRGYEEPLISLLWLLFPLRAETPTSAFFPGENSISLVLRAGKRRSNQALIWTTPVCFLDPLQVIISTVMLERSMEARPLNN